ncbi:putative manganese transporter [Bacteroidota bacterium]
MHDHGHTNFLGLIGGEIHFENIFQFLVEILQHTLIITAFVIIMMLLIEYLSVQTQGRWNKKFEKNPFLQILIAALLGFMPGCLGVYLVVSLYVHRIFHFAALTTAMIATSGDEAFVMFAMIPGKALWIMGVLFLVSLLAGYILHLFPIGKHKMKLAKNHMMLHDHNPDCKCFIPSEIIPQLRHISFERAVLLLAGVLFLIFLLSGDIGPDNWNWQRIVFLIVLSIELFISLTVPDHFLRKHLWDHVIRKHFLRVFIWTFGAFLVIHVGLEFLHFEDWIKDNQLSILLIAILIGIIPESGPHIIFITLYATGNIPLSILLANSVVQDGHGSIPLLAETRIDFLRVKGMNLLIGLLLGLAGLLLGF